MRCFILFSVVALAAANLSKEEQDEFNRLLQKSGKRAADGLFQRVRKDSHADASAFDVADRLKVVEDAVKVDALSLTITKSINDAMKANAAINAVVKAQSDFAADIKTNYVQVAAIKEFQDAINTMKNELQKTKDDLTASTKKAASDNKIAFDAATKKNAEGFTALSKKVTDDLVKAKKDITDTVGKKLKGTDTVLTALKLTHYGNPSVPVFRWQKFHTHQGSGISWFDGNNANGYAGIHPSQWTDGNYHCNRMANDFKYLARLFTRRGTANKYGGNICSDTYIMYSSTTGLMCGVVFRIKNTKTSTISWRPSWRTTSWSGWSEHSSVSLNGQNNYYSGGCYRSCAPTVTLNIPANGSGNRMSTVVFMSGGTNVVSMGHNLHERAVLNHFRDNALALPSGLEYVDDLDVKSGAWKV